MIVSEIVGRMACCARDAATPQNPAADGLCALATGSQVCPLCWLIEIVTSTTASAATADGVLKVITDRPCQARSDTLYCRAAVKTPSATPMTIDRIVEASTSWPLISAR